MRNVGVRAGATYRRLQLVLEPGEVVVQVGALHRLLAPTRDLGDDAARLQRTKGLKN